MNQMPKYFLCVSLAVKKKEKEESAVLKVDKTKVLLEM